MVQEGHAGWRRRGVQFTTCMPPRLLHPPMCTHSKSRTILTGSPLRWLAAAATSAECEMVDALGSAQPEGRCRVPACPAELEPPSHPLGSHHHHRFTRLAAAGTTLRCWSWRSPPRCPLWSSCPQTRCAPPALAAGRAGRRRMHGAPAPLPLAAAAALHARRNSAGPKAWTCCSWAMERSSRTASPPSA